MNAYTHCPLKVLQCAFLRKMRKTKDFQCGKSYTTIGNFSQSFIFTFLLYITLLHYIPSSLLPILHAFLNFYPHSSSDWTAESHHFNAVYPTALIQWQLHPHCHCLQPNSNTNPHTIHHYLSISPKFYPNVAHTHIQTYSFQLSSILTFSYPPLCCHRGISYNVHLTKLN